MKKIFDTYIDNAFDGCQQAWFKFPQFEHNYRRFFPADLKSSLLDIGVGRGEMLTCMKNWGYLNFLGIDISPSTIQFCRSLNLPCTLVENTAVWLRQSHQPYQVITLLDVLEHIPKPDVIEFLEALKMALDSDGRLIVQLPNLQSPDAQLHRYNDITHEFGYTEHSLQQVVIAAGLSIDCFGGFESLVLGGFKEKIKKVLRSLYYAHVRLTRKISDNLNPRILNPILFAVIKRKDAVRE